LDPVMATSPHTTTIRLTAGAPRPTRLLAPSRQAKLGFITRGNAGNPALSRAREKEAMAHLLSVNVGLPRDIAWRGKTVHTAIWKAPVRGRRMARRLNIDGDGQGDLEGHGGEHRAVFVYQIDSYRYWRRRLGRSDLSYGQFGENFTVDGLSDVERRWMAKADLTIAVVPALSRDP
jgi:hypothetical protein